MAEVNQRSWKLPGQRTKRKAWGYTATIGGRRVRAFKAEWSKDDAQAELDKAKLTGAPVTRGHCTLTQAAERYLADKARKKSLKEDKRQLEHLKLAFGAETQLAALTPPRISEYRAQRLGNK